MNPQLKLSSPRLLVILGNPDDPDSWSSVEVQTIGRDTTAAETLFGVKKFGRTMDHPVLSLTAIAYYGLLRTGRFQGSWEDFESAYVEIQPLGMDDSFPTVPEPATA